MGVISGIFRETGRVLKRHTGRLVFTFHHWDPNAWAELSVGLKQAGFRLVNCYVVSSEHPVSVHINNLNSIKHDTILVLALNGDGSARHWPPVTRIDTSDSEKFCQRCGSALGWLLDSDCSPVEIRAIWKNLIYANLVTRYGLKPEGYSPDDASRFALYNLERQAGSLRLISSRFVSTSVEEVYQAMRNNHDLPSKDGFVKVLNTKLRAKLSVQFS